MEEVSAPTSLEYFMPAAISVDSTDFCSLRTFMARSALSLFYVLIVSACAKECFVVRQQERVGQWGKLTRGMTGEMK